MKTGSDDKNSRLEFTAKFIESVFCKQTFAVVLRERGMI